MVVVGRDLWRSSSPTAPIEQSPGVNHTWTSPAGFECLQRVHNLSRHPYPELWHPLSEECFPYGHMEPSVFQFVSVVPCAVTGCHWEESVTILLTATLYILTSTDKIAPQSHLLQVKQHQLSQLFLIRWVFQSGAHKWNQNSDFIVQ